MRQRLIGAIASLVMFPTAASAQQEARPEDVATLDGIMRAYYEVVSGPAGESADLERDRTLHHPEAWIAVANEDSSGKPVVPFTRDVNSVTLFYDDERWWIMNWMYDESSG